MDDSEPHVYGEEFIHNCYRTKASGKPFVYDVTHKGRRQNMSLGEVTKIFGTEELARAHKRMPEWPAPAKVRTRLEKDKERASQSGEDSLCEEPSEETSIAGATVNDGRLNPSDGPVAQSPGPPMTQPSVGASSSSFVQPSGSRFDFAAVIGPSYQPSRSTTALGTWQAPPVHSEPTVALQSLLHGGTATEDALENTPGSRDSATATGEVTKETHSGVSRGRSSSRAVGTRPPHQTAHRRARQVEVLEIQTSTTDMQTPVFSPQNTVFGLSKPIEPAYPYTHGASIEPQNSSFFGMSVANNIHSQARQQPFRTSTPLVSRRRRALSPFGSGGTPSSTSSTGASSPFSSGVLLPSPSTASWDLSDEDLATYRDLQRHLRMDRSQKEQ